MPLLLEVTVGGWFERVQDDGVCDGADGAGVVLAAGIAVGAATLAGTGWGSSRPGGDQVVLGGQLGG